MRKQKPDEFELVKIQGAGKAVFAVDLTPRIQKLIDRGEVSVLAKAKRGRATEKAEEPSAAVSAEQSAAAEGASREA